MPKKQKTRRVMNPIEFTAAIDGLGLRQAAVARGLDVDRTTVRRWQRGLRAIPGPVRMLVLTWLKWPQTKPE